jgi:hypothetical protein
MKGDVGDVARTIEVFELSALLRPLLAGREPAVQGAALADAMATYLRGHHAPEGRDTTNVLRGLIMSRWLENGARSGAGRGRARALSLSSKRRGKLLKLR